jgi:hypothetical protein
MPELNSDELNIVTGGITYLCPDVYVEELATKAPSIPGVSTSTHGQQTSLLPQGWHVGRRHG